MTPLRILHAIGQRPEMTGSGIYLEAMIRESRKYGFSTYRVAGVPAGTVPSLKNRPQTECAFVFFEPRKRAHSSPLAAGLASELEIDIHRLYGIPLNQIVVVGGGYDQTIFNRAPKSPAGTVHILYAGKYNRSKGVPWLLTSLMKIKHHDWHLHMAGGGKGQEYDHCIDLAEKLGQKVTNHGYVSHRRLSELMTKAHIQLLPSFFEGLPLVLFEGLASGCRIITTELSGFKEIFGKANKETIDLIQLPPLETIDRPYRKDEARLEDALCQRMLDMMAVVRKSPNVVDPQAEKIASRYTWPRIFKRTLSVYRDAVKR